MIKKVKDYLMLNGAKYTGDFDTINNVPHGLGTYENSSVKYVGKFKQGSFYGIGDYVDKDKKYRYNGEFKDNGKNGFGAIICDNGNYFEGVFENNIINGIGYQTYNDGEKYIGEYKNNVANGKGTVYYSNGNVFTGEFLNDKEDGIGVVKEKDNNQYAIKVEYKNGKGNILGLMKLTSDLNTNMVYRIVKSEGLFLGMIDKFGKYVEGIYHYPNGDIFVGEFNDEFKKGVMYKKNDKYSGFFENDLLVGKGIYENEKGEIFEGEFNDGIMEGIFIYTNLDENKEKRLYNKGVLISTERLVQ